MLAELQLFIAELTTFYVVSSQLNALILLTSNKCNTLEIHMMDTVV